MQCQVTYWFLQQYTWGAPTPKTNTTEGRETRKGEVFWNLARFELVYTPINNVKLQNNQLFLPKGPDDFLRAYQTHINKPQNKIKQNQLRDHYVLGASFGSVWRGLARSQEFATPQNQSQYPQRQLNTPRTWPSSCTSFFDTLSSFFTANCGFVSHSLVAPGSRRVSADQQNSSQN